MCKQAWQLRLAWWGAQMAERKQRERELKEHLASCAACQAEWEVDKRRIDAAVMPEGEE